MFATPWWLSVFLTRNGQRAVFRCPIQSPDLSRRLIVQRSIDYAGNGKRIQAFYVATHKVVEENTSATDHPIISGSSLLS
jgi:hypothetical protein